MNLKFPFASTVVIFKTIIFSKSKYILILFLVTILYLINPTPMFQFKLRVDKILAK